MMNKLYYHQMHKSPIGSIHLVLSDTEIHHIYFGKYKSKISLKDVSKSLSHYLPKAIEQLREYFSGRRNVFDLDIQPKGTEFELAVWNETMRIPYGEVKTYKEIAKAIGNPKSSRAVGNALNKNLIPIIIPCHRVVSTQNVGGFASGVGIKRKLLALEAGQTDNIDSLIPGE